MMLSIYLKKWDCNAGQTLRQLTTGCSQARLDARKLVPELKLGNEETSEI